MRLRERIGWLLLSLATGVAIFAVGGAPRNAVVAFALLAALAAAAFVPSKRWLERPAPLLVLLTFAIVLSICQLVPMGAGAVETLNPIAYQIAVDNAELLGHKEPGSIALSLDPPGTFFELAKLLAYFALAWVALRLSVSDRGRRRIVATVAGVIGAAAVVGVVNKLISARSLYGLYEPKYVFAEFMGPLLNPNHFASLLVVGALLAGGLALMARQSVLTRALWVGVSLLCAVESLLIQSRGAAIALACGLFCSASVLGMQRWRTSERKASRPNLLRVTVPVAVVVLCSLVLVVFFSAGGVTEQLAETEVEEWTEPRSKFAAWRSAAQLMEDSPWMGVGRGAFEPAFTRIHPGSGFLTYSHLENEYLQVAVDWGIPAALAMALILSWLALLAFRRWKDGPLAAAGLGALVAVAAHSVVDFGLELPGLAVPVILIAATLTYVPVRSVPSNLRRYVFAGRGVGVFAIAMAAVVLATPWGRTLHEDQRLLRASSPVTEDMALEMMERHPADYLAPAALAYALHLERDERANLFLNHALLLHPTHPDLHRLAARMLLKGGQKKQALVEYHIAVANTLNPAQLIAEVVQLFPDVEDAVRVMPLDHDRPRRIAKILTDLKRPDIALNYLSRVARDHASNPRYLEHILALASRVDDYPNQKFAAERLAKMTGSAVNWTQYAQILLDHGEIEPAKEAITFALKGRGGSQDRGEVLLLQVDVFMAAKDWPAARAALEAMKEMAEVYGTKRRAIHLRLAKIEEALGNKREAEWERRRAGVKD